jgi:hypothetical protein
MILAKIIKDCWDIWLRLNYCHQEWNLMGGFIPKKVWKVIKQDEMIEKEEIQEDECTSCFQGANFL